MDIVLSMMAIYLGIGLLFIGGFFIFLIKTFLDSKSNKK